MTWFLGADEEKFRYYPEDFRNSPELHRYIVNTAKRKGINLEIDL